MDNNFEEDPAAQFLASEENKLAELEDDALGLGGPPPDTEQPTVEDADLSDDDLVPVPHDDFGIEEGERDFNAGDSNQFGADIDGTIPEPIIMNGPASMFQNGPTEPLGGTTDSAAGKYNIPEIEPEKIIKWRQEQKERLEKKDAEAEDKRIEWREIAKKELDDWYRNRAEQLEKTKNANREAEAAFVEQRDEKDPGLQWERIARLCEFNPKVSKSTKDTSRLRSLLLQLKTQQPGN